MKHRNRMLTVLLFAAVTLTGLAHGQVESRKLLEMTFKTPEAYERFKDWVADTKNLRSAFIDTNEAWSNEAAQWLAANVQNATAEEDGEWRILTIQSGELNPDIARRYMERVSNGYMAMLAGRDREKNEAERAEKEAIRDNTQDEIDELNMNLDRMPHGGDLDKLQESLAQSNDALLETNLLMAELQAQLETIRKELLTEIEQSENSSVTESVSADSIPALLAEQLKNAEKDLAQAEAMFKQGTLSSAELGAVRQSVGNAKLEFMRARGQQAAASPLQQKLREMLIDSETEFAGVSARSKALQDHITKQEQELEAVQQLHAQIARAERRHQDLDRQLNPADIRQVRAAGPARQPSDELAWVWVR